MLRIKATVPIGSTEYNKIKLCKLIIPTNTMFISTYKLSKNVNLLFYYLPI